MLMYIIYIPVHLSNEIVYRCEPNTGYGCISVCKYDLECHTTGALDLSKSPSFVFLPATFNYKKVRKKLQTFKLPFKIFGKKTINTSNANSTSINDFLEVFFTCFFVQFGRKRNSGIDVISVCLLSS